MENDETKNSSNAIGGVIGLIIILALIGWVFKIGPFGKDYSKPWFEGAERNVVCKLPDYNNSQCYTLVVDSDGEYITQINFPSGGYRIVDYSECYEAAEGYYNFDHFCRAWDTKGDSWDVMPIGSNPN